MDVPSMMRQATALNRDRGAIITEDTTLTYGEMWTRGVRLANALIELGVRPGDRVGGLEDNNLGAADLFLGAAIAGAVRVPLYARNSAESHAHMVGQTGTSVVLTDAAYADSVADLPATVDSVRHVVVRDEGYEKWLAGQSDTDPEVSVGSDDWYVIRHSAGTTGKPKGIGYTQHDWLVNCRNWFYRLPNLHWGSVVGHAGPISHASGYLFLPAWLHGSTNLLFGAFDSTKVLDMMERHHVTHMFAPPSMVQMLSADSTATARDLAALECILIGGAPITDATANAGRAVFGDVMYQVFGQTEAVPLTVMTPAEWFGEFEGSTPMRAAGRVLPFARVQTRDEDGKVLPLGEEGELWAQVEGQMREFWGDDEQTAEMTARTPGGRLGANPRHRPDRRQRLRLRPRPGRRHDRLGRVQHLAGRTGDGDQRPPRGDRGRGLRHPAREVGRGAHGGVPGGRGRRGHPGGDRRAGHRATGLVQEARPGGLHPPSRSRRPSSGS